MSFMFAKVAVKPSNGEFLSFIKNGDGEGNDRLTSGNCEDWMPEIIFSVPMALNGAYIQTHTREMITVKENGQLGLKPNNQGISETELFDFICLGLNRVAIKAHNGKFVSFQPNNNKLLFASSDTIGPHETFEVIVIFR